MLDLDALARLDEALPEAPCEGPDVALAPVFVADAKGAMCPHLARAPE